MADDADHTLASAVIASKKSLMTIHDAIDAEHLESYVVGRRRYIRAADLSAWLDWLKAESDAGRPVVYRSRATERMPRKERINGLKRVNAPGTKAKRRAEKERQREASSSA